MKTLLALAVLLFAAPAFAGDIVLTDPVVKPSITKVTIDAFSVTAGQVDAIAAYRAADGTLYQAVKVTLVDSCSLPQFTTKQTCEAATPTPGVWDNAYSAVVNYTIKADDVGKDASAVLEKQVRQEVRKKLNLAGTTP